MQLTRKFLACSLPLGFLALAFVCAAGNSGMPQTAQAATIADAAATESPAQLRLTALDTLMKGDKHSALDLYEEAIRLATKQFGAESTFLGDLYYEAGKLYLDLDQFNQAENYLGQAIKINPKNASARLALAKLLDTEKKVQESIGQIREALVINPTSPVARERFIHTLAKYGRTPSDKAIATQEAITLASMQRMAKESLLQQHTLDEKKIEQIKATRAKSMIVPSLPKNLAPIKEDGEGSADTKGSTRIETKNQGASQPEVKESVKEPAREPVKEPARESVKDETKPSIKPSSALTLFPLQSLSDRKKHDALNREIEERAKKRMAEEMKKAGSTKAETAGKDTKPDVVEKIKEQARQQEKAKSSKRRAEKQKPISKEKSAKEKASSKEGDTSNRHEAQQAAPQQAAPQQMMQPYVPVPVFQPPVYSAPPAKTGKHGFVPPPPPTMPMYPGMMPPVVPQMIPAQTAKPPSKPASKPKVEKPKATTREEAPPAEDKPPPMTSGSQEDTSFLLDWSETKPKSKKKTK